MGLIRPARRATLLAVSLSVALGAGAPAAAQQSIADYTRDFHRQDGFFPIHWDATEGRLLLEIGRFDEPFLYLTSLATGIGSNALGLDRGEIGDEYIAHFERIGPRVRLVLENPAFRAGAGASHELERSVEESFPTSVVGAFDILVEEGGRVLVDATSFFLRDAWGVAGALRRAGEGTFRVDERRSAIWLPRTRAFPENTEVEASLTFASDEPGSEVRRHTPDGRALTLRQHHSLVKLPDPGYEPRRFDPRVGIFGVRYFDFARSYDEGYEARWASRHRLIKRNPDAAMSEPVEPIVYYLDPGIPEPYRSAFREGGAWWNEVFEAAGFIDAFRIEDMPPDMDPMDARYNVIQWVHRTEAGSSIGPSFRDPRTGEIIKAAVRMDSHRSLVDYNLYAGAVGTDGDWIGPDPGISAEDFVMARRRQHAAHEIGHTLGLAHNFIAISYGHASVMDYPAPLIRVTDDVVDLTAAYRPGAGAYDTLAVRYAYTPLPPGPAGEAWLDSLLVDAQRRGWHFITNPDAGGSNSYPAASTWINGTDVLDELERSLRVRRFLIDRFDERAIERGAPMALLRERFTPVYLHHRFILDAAVKTIGGMEYRYGVRGDPSPVTQVIEADRVNRALDLLTRALSPSELAIPERILRILGPTPYGHSAEPRAIRTRADPAFDQVEAARTLASMVLDGALHPARAARVVAFHDRDPSLPSLEDVIGRFVDAAWDRRAAAGGATLARVVQRVLVDELIDLAADDDATVEARAAAEWGLRRALQKVGAGRVTSNGDAAHRQLVVADINRFLERGWEAAERTEPLRPPPGTPIGGGGPNGAP